MVLALAFRKGEYFASMPTTDLMIEALIQKRKEGLADGEALTDYFWQLVERYRAHLINQAFSILGNQSDAEDVAQESLCEAFQDLTNLKDSRLLVNWLRQINRRNAMDLLRSRKSESNKIQRARKESGILDAVSGGFSKVDIREAVARAIDHLPEKLREIVVLRYWEHMPYRDLAKRLDIPLGTVKSQLARADTLLEKQLNKFLENAAPENTPDAATARESQAQ